MLKWSCDTVFKMIVCLSNCLGSYGMLYNLWGESKVIRKSECQGLRLLNTWNCSLLFLHKFEAELTPEAGFTALL